MGNDSVHMTTSATSAATTLPHNQDDHQHKGKLLLVGDCLDILRLLRLFFESKGYEVWVEVNVLKVMSACKEFQPDVVLLDVNVPHVDINYIYGTLRTDQDTNQTPLVFLTQGEASHLRLVASRQGVKDHTVRLPAIRELVNCVEAALSTASGHICGRLHSFSACV